MRRQERWSEDDVKCQTTTRHDSFRLIYQQNEPWQSTLGRRRKYFQFQTIKDDLMMSIIAQDEEEGEGESPATL